MQAVSFSFHLIWVKMSEAKLSILMQYKGLTVRGRKTDAGFYFQLPLDLGKTALHSNE